MCKSSNPGHTLIKFTRLTLAAGMASLLLSLTAPELSPMGTACAAEDGHSGGHSSGGHSSGSHGGQSAGGHDDVVHDHTDSDHGSRGGPNRHGAHDGQGHGHDIARGAGKSVVTKVFRGRQPVWAREGIPEVELGRLNVSRAPARVLSRAEEEALSRYTSEMATLYNLSADEAAAVLKASYRETARLDSPLQNLAMYEQVMTFGHTELQGIQTDSPIDLAAIFLGSASDKNLPVTEDTVIALNRILGLKEMDADQRTELATKANTVREAILVGHGPEMDH